MTRNKFNRLVKQLIDKYGDVVIVNLYDYYLSQIISDEKLDTIVHTFKLSDYLSDSDDLVFNRSLINMLESIASGKDDKIIKYVEIPKSKQLYDSEEQVKLREKRKNEFRFATFSLFSSFQVQKHYDLITTFEDWTRDSISPKNYGRYLSNK